MGYNSSLDRAYMTGYELKVEWEGRMGFNQSKTYEIYVDGEMVGFSKRKWLAKAIAEAIVNGDIGRTGDTTGRYAMWASENDPEKFDRMGNGY